jgi:hypothetical protein
MVDYNPYQTGPHHYVFSSRWHILRLIRRCPRGITPWYCSSQLLYGIVRTTSRSAAVKKPVHPLVHWYRFVNGTFVVWLHGKDPGKHLNSIHPKVKLTMEVEPRRNGLTEQGSSSCASRNTPPIVCFLVDSSSHIRSLKMGTEMVPETLISFDHLTRLMA